jgi:hypothetical protein
LNQRIKSITGAAPCRKGSRTRDSQSKQKQYALVLYPGGKACGKARQYQGSGPGLLMIVRTAGTEMKQNDGCKDEEGQRDVGVLGRSLFSEERSRSQDQSG